MVDNGITFVHTGDVHIGSPFTGLPLHVASKRRQEIMSSFLHILDFVKEKKVNYLFIAGDLFENDYVTTNDLQQINEAFRQLVDTHICMIAGNHDPILGDKSFYNRVSWGENVHLFTKDKESIYFEDHETTVYGHSWYEKYVQHDAIKSIHKRNQQGHHILLAHGDAYTKSNYLPLDIRSLKDKNFDYVALGHIHRPAFITDEICYCGSPEALNFGEGHEHGFIAGEIMDHIIYKKFIPIAKRHYKKVEVRVQPNAFEADIINDIRQSINNHDLFRIILKGQADFRRLIDISYIQQQVSEEVFYSEIIDERDTLLDFDSIEKEHSHTIIGDFIQQMKAEGLDDPVNKRALEIGLELLLNEKGVDL
ncbi:metallophosphoesterase family protein [Vallitalea okinawensis]|uniref:metallophosphoesterase family protein n=1 Tax=Vallitalea okinawensis TaxID=2078660 RepID=UPI000CFACEC5|nr:DNA repair exonuclease [Vallitalea okinawensis]